MAGGGLARIQRRTLVHSRSSIRLTTTRPWDMIESETQTGSAASIGNAH